MKKAKIKQIKDIINTTPIQELKPDELTVKKKVPHVQITHDDTSSEEEEIIIKKKKKKPKKKRIIYESSSEEEEEYEPPPPPPKKKVSRVKETPANTYPAILFF